MITSSLSFFHHRSILPCTFFFFFNDTATTEIYTLSLHDALPISLPGGSAPPQRCNSGLPPRSGRTFRKAGLVRKQPWRRAFSRKARQAGREGLRRPWPCECAPESVSSRSSPGLVTAAGHDGALHPPQPS